MRRQYKGIGKNEKNKYVDNNDAVYNIDCANCHL